MHIRTVISFAFLVDLILHSAHCICIVDYLWNLVIVCYWNNKPIVLHILITVWSNPACGDHRQLAD